jgi:putative spermidine/putrescine transport system permease protein
VAFIVAHTVLAIPFVVISVGASLTGFDRDVELASASLGANRVTTWRRVTLPLIMPGVLSGFVFAFVTSFDEVVVSLFIQTPSATTLPVVMYQSVTQEIDPTIGAASSLMVVVTTVLLLIPTLARRKERQNWR